MAFRDNVLAFFISLLTPALREFLKSATVSLWEMAQKTENEFDDVFVRGLAFLLGVELGPGGEENNDGA